MNTIAQALRWPLALLAVSLVVLCLAAWVGARDRGRLRRRVAEARDDFGIILGATLTLLALIIGFTFSMALRAGTRAAARLRRAAPGVISDARRRSAGAGRSAHGARAG